MVAQKDPITSKDISYALFRPPSGRNVCAKISNKKRILTLILKIENEMIYFVRFLNRN